jgi:hypothetical protein
MRPLHCSCGCPMVTLSGPFRPDAPGGIVAQAARDHLNVCPACDGDAADPVRVRPRENGAE